MPRTIISDTRCIILLDRIGELDILKKLQLLQLQKLQKNSGNRFLHGFKSSNPKTKIINC